MNFEYKVESSPENAWKGGAVNLIINAVLAYFFYTYWQNNPDEGSCYATDGSHTPSAVPVGGYTDVSGHFANWFMWGFIINVAAIVMAVLQFLHSATEADIFAGLVGCVGCPIGCGGLVWFIAGLFWRYSSTGNVCSGDYFAETLVTDPSAGQIGDLPYQWSSGKFINYYYLTVLCIFGAVCCCGCVCAIGAAVVAGSQ